MDKIYAFSLGLDVGVVLVLAPVLTHTLLTKQRKHDEQPAALAALECLTSPSMEALEAEFRITTTKLHDIVKHFTSELHKGLSAPGQTIKALPSYVTRLPSGQETGTFLALDLGGTNLRVCEVVLEGHGKFRVRQKKFVIGDDLKVGTHEMLFDFIADSIAVFLREFGIVGGLTGQKQLSLGFTFSFPVDQTAINVGTLMQWNKGFEVTGCLNENIVALLDAALIRKDLNIKVVALVNDTVGTLVAHHYIDPDTYIGVIIGTGSNAAYVEKIPKIPKWKTHYADVHVPSEMVVNIEWGAFDNERVVLPVTSYDNKLDRATENPGLQTLEKMISGMYLGEISRLILVGLIHSGELFNGKSSSKLMESYAFQTQYMSRIERDHSLDLTDTKSILEDLFEIFTSALADRQMVKRVCELVGIRSARLSAACVAGVIGKMNKLNGCTVAIDGSVFEHYPHYRNRMDDALREIFGLCSESIELELARDGSGVGAALIAAVMSEDL